MAHPIRILVLTRSSWNNNNSCGNTLTNLFQDWDSEQLAHIYTRDELPNTNRCSRYFKISESSLFQNLLGKSAYAGERLDYEPGADVETLATEKALASEAMEKRMYDFFRSHRFMLFVWAREVLWKIGRWKSPTLHRFLREVSPDIVFAESSDSLYIYDVLAYAKKITGAKVVMFHLDDLASFEQLSFSPLYWINRALLRLKLQSAVRAASLNYCITDEQSAEYSKIFRRQFQVLRKVGSFEQSLVVHREPRLPLRIVYTGNIIYGRWKVLLSVARALHRINREGVKATLSIYSANPLLREIRPILNYPESVQWMGRIDSSLVPATLVASDILLHVESSQLKQRLITRLSFSTKIVDYLQAHRCILAIGDSSTASIAYLKHNDAALIASNTRELESILEMLIGSPHVVKEYGEKAWNCGVRKHERKRVLGKFRADLYRLVRGG